MALTLHTGAALTGLDDTEDIGLERLNLGTLTIGRLTGNE